MRRRRALAWRFRSGALVRAPLALTRLWHTPTAGEWARHSFWRRHHPEALFRAQQGAAPARRRPDIGGSICFHFPVAHRRTPPNGLSSRQEFARLGRNRGSGSPTHCHSRSRLFPNPDPRQEPPNPSDHPFAHTLASSPSPLAPSSPS